MHQPALASTLELQLSCVSGDDYALTARLTVPHSPADVSLIVGGPAQVRFDPEALLALRGDPAAYGARLHAMLFADQRAREALLKARAQADALGKGLRVVLRLDPTDPLPHSLAWETLADPADGGFLFTSERLLLSRYLESDSLAPLRLRPRGALSALVVVAGPGDLATYGLAPVDVAAEASRATAALGLAQVRVIAGGQGGPASLAAVGAALRDGPDILYLVCHGSSRAGQPVLWLERPDGTSERVSGEAFAQLIAGLERRPLLVALASCQSAGDGHGDALSALGPQLARAGVPAVLAMQGNLTMETAAVALPAFFRELQRDGQIDRAAAVARAAAHGRPDWWAPVLFMRLRDGRIWAEAAPAAGAAVDRNRQRMLARVRDFWVRGVLESAGGRVAMIDLAMLRRPAAVDNPWATIVRQAGGEQAERERLAASQIIPLFDDAQGELLILGRPGSGKTTLLLTLARALIERAEGDPAQPIPVVFHLASWRARYPALEPWLVEELYTRYDVPQPIGRAWVGERQILPLLDGFDEVAADQRRACLDAINAFDRAEAMGGLVVCSRIGEYEGVGARLRLQAAVEVQTLGDAEVMGYLERAGDALANVRALYRVDQHFRSLIETPLMLNVVSAAYGGDVQMPTTISRSIWRQYIFGAYVRRMLERRGDSGYPPQRIVAWLGALARTLERHRQGTFLIERMQPTWLPNVGDRLRYGLLARLLSGLGVGLVSVGLILPVAGWQLALAAGAMGLLSWSLAWGRLRPGLVGLVYACAVGAGLYAVAPPMSLGYLLAHGALGMIIVGFGAWLLARQARFDRIECVASLSWSWGAGLRAGLLAGGLGALPAILLLALLTRDWTIMLSAGAAVGTIAGTIAGVAVGTTARDLETSTRPNDGIRRTLRTALRVAAISGLAFGVVGVLFGVAIGSVAERLSLGGQLLPGLTNIWLTGLSGLLAGLLLAFLAFGGLAVLQHLILRLTLYRAGMAPWRYAAFLDSCVERVILHRVGGGYIFIHRTLMEYFAGNPEL